MEMRNQSQSGRASYSRKKLTSKIETQWPGQKPTGIFAKHMIATDISTPPALWTRAWDAADRMSREQHLRG
jgi:hypothetical protein